MQIDQNKFMNLVLDKTSEKMNQLQVQVIVLETQLAMAVDNYNLLKAEFEQLQKENSKSSKKNSEFTN